MIRLSLPVVHYSLATEEQSLKLVLSQQWKSSVSDCIFLTSRAGGQFPTTLFHLPTIAKLARDAEILTQISDRDLNPKPLDWQSSALTTRPPHASTTHCISYRRILLQPLTWYLPKAYTSVSRMKPRYGTSSVHASSSRVANAEQAASCTLLFASSTRFSN